MEEHESPLMPTRRARRARLGYPTHNFLVHFEAPPRIRSQAMKVLTSHPEALADAFMTIIWWTNGVFGSLFAMDWAVRRYFPRLETWIARQREIDANRVADELPRDGS